ncbi:hypothetical protein T4D_13249 [Trichinella pseudospiralis]|uniref:Uncharacterized protein n=1 Tax=Trichinella pseudospiralis TaxID=6337 RepID=A0A0V1FBM9_TRIPS|nr:hypothetical protein T4D_13249 [Trichinella pseudospiralis]
MPFNAALSQQSQFNCLTVNTVPICIKVRHCERFSKYRFIALHMLLKDATLNSLNEHYLKIQK